MNVLKLTFYVVFSSFILLFSCKSTGKVTSFENTLYPDGRFFIVKPTDEATTKRFEYFLLEANRYKMLGDLNKAVLYYKEALDVDTACATCYYELAQLLYQSGDTKNSEIYAFKSVQLDPSNEWFLSFLSKLYHQNNKPDLALESAKFLVKQYPDNIEHLYNVAQFEYSLEKYDDAIITLNKIEKLLGKSEFLSLEKHSIYNQKKDYKSAEKELKNLIVSYPGNSDYRVYLGDFYTQRNRLKEALLEYQTVISNDANNTLAYFSISNYYLLVNDSLNFKTSLIKAFKSTGSDFESKFQRFIPFLMNIDQPENPLNDSDFKNIFDAFLTTHSHESKVFLLYANYLNHKGNIKDALSAYESALLIDEKQEDVWQDFLFLSLNNHSKEDFLKHCLDGVSVFQENSIIHYLTGVAYSFNEKRTEAINHLKEVIKYSKDNAKLESQAYGFLGDLYYQENDKVLSFENYQKSVDLDDKQVGVLNNYAYYLCLENEQLDKAERMISKVIEIEPKNPTYLDTYAWILFKRERYFEALFIIEQAINYDTESNGVIFEHYGDILFKNGNIDKAVEYWKKAYDTKDEDLSVNLEKKISEKLYIK